MFEDEVFRAPAGLRQQFIDVGGGHHAKHGTCICGRVHQLSLSRRRALTILDLA